MIEKYSGPDPREQERRRVARIMQEKVEKQGDIVRALHRWDMRMVANNSCAIFPGDYVAVGDGCMCSSRGVQVDMSAADIAKMIDIGGLEQVFDMDDLNSPNLDAKIDDIMKQVEAQRNFHDAHCYRKRRDEETCLECAVAIYEFPGSTPEEPPVSAAVERSGDEFRFRNGAGTGDFPWRECNYEEFNPGGANIIAELRGDEKPEPTVNKTSAYERMLEHYEATGGGEPEKPGDAARRIPGYDKMSPSEQLAAQVRLSDEYHKAQERAASQEKSPDAADQWGPRLPGQRRTGF